jgi:hypothetical protein
MTPNPKNTPKIFYVYAWLRTADDEHGPEGWPYYIGKGKGNRAYAWHAKIGFPPQFEHVVILQHNLSENDAFNSETRLIEFYGRIDLGTGILRNGSKGGCGGSQSEESRRKISEAVKENAWKKRIRRKRMLVVPFREGYKR